MLNLSIFQTVTGVLKGYDQLLNLVLDDVEEQVECMCFCLLSFHILKINPAQSVPEPRVRSLGLVVLRGPTIILLSPVDGSEEIANPFLSQE